MNDFMQALMASAMPVFEQPGEGGPGSEAGAGDDDKVWAAPEGLAADFVGKDADETITKLMGGYKEASERADGLRTKLSGMPGAPGSADDYKFEPSDDVKPWFGEPDKNPIMAVARTSAHKLGLSNDQFGGFINEVYSTAAKEGLILPPLDPASEIKSFGKHSGITDEGALTQELEQNESFAKGLLSQLKGLPEDEGVQAAITGQMMALTDTHEGNLLLRALRQRLGESGFKMDSTTSTQEGSFFAKEELQKLSGDKRADPKNKEYDEEFRKKLDASYTHHHKGE